MTGMYPYSLIQKQSAMNNKKEIKTDTQVFALVNEMIRFSDVYMALRDENDELWEDNETRLYIALLNLFRLKQPYPVLMAAKINLDDNEFKQLLKVIVTICFRYNIICDRNPNDQDLPFNNMAMLISNERRVDYSLLAPINVEDTEFMNSFQEKSFPYNSRYVKIIRYILGKIEHFKESGLDVQYDDENASVEHILPQNYDEQWNIDDEKAGRLMWRLGNTCLLEKRLNRNLKNFGFAEKKAFYAQSSYYYARKIAEDVTQWDENVIVRRQKEMAKAAVSIWKMPKRNA